LFRDVGSYWGARTWNKVRQTSERAKSMVMVDFGEDFYKS